MFQFTLEITESINYLICALKRKCQCNAEHSDTFHTLQNKFLLKPQQKERFHAFDFIHVLYTHIHTHLHINDIGYSVKERKLLSYNLKIIGQKIE